MAIDVDGVRQNTNPYVHAAPVTRRTFDVDGQAVGPGALVEVDNDPPLVAIHPGLADGGVVAPVRPVDHSEGHNERWTSVGNYALIKTIISKQSTVQ